MSRVRRLWTGPSGTDFRAAWSDLEIDAGTSPLWLVPTSEARDQVLVDQVRRRGVRIEPRVVRWTDLGPLVRRAAGDGPRLWSDHRLVAVLDEAIAAGRKARRLPRLGPLADHPGFRRRLLGRFLTWGLAEWNHPPGGLGDDTLIEQWAVYRKYQELLAKHCAVDRSGLFVWALGRLRDRPPPGWDVFEAAFWTEPDAIPSRPRTRILDWLDASAVTLHVGVIRTGDGDPVESLRENLLGRGFEDVALSVPRDRPPGLAGVERSLFRDEPDRPERSEGLRILGAPQGEGEGRLVAREVRSALEAGLAPDDLAVAVPRWDESAEVLVRTLRRWGLPLRTRRPIPVSTSPRVAVLRLAMGLPGSDWDTARLVRLLRNRTLRLPKASPESLADAAVAIRETGVLRGADTLDRDLERLIVHDPGESPNLSAADVRAHRLAGDARSARAVLLMLARLFEPMTKPASFGMHLTRLRRLAAGLGLDRDDPDDPGWETFRLALDETAEARALVRSGPKRQTWEEFVGEVEGLLRDLTFEPPTPDTRGVLVATADELAGCRYERAIVAGLTEGTYPDRASLTAQEPDDQEEGESGETTDCREVRQMRRFLALFGLARRELVLVAPTTDPSGQRLLEASYLDDVRRLFPEGTFEPPILRLDPCVLGDLAGSAADRRVEAVALAFRDGALDSLRTLMTDAVHREPFRATASALKLARHRWQKPGFSRYEGRLDDPAILRRLAREFGPDRPALSPSYLESYVACPFQFFNRAVLGLEPIREKGELDEDRTGRGSLVHRALEQAHRAWEVEPIADPERLAALIETAFAAELAALADADHPIDAGLRAIESELVRRIGRRYLRQFDRYRENQGAGAVPVRFEISFGRKSRRAFKGAGWTPEDENNPDPEFPPLVVGVAPNAVALQGTIDRIDLLSADESGRFRVIDYKTGKAPTKSDVLKGNALQLSLYALAVERLGLLADSGMVSAAADFGYWGLGESGFRPAAPSTDAWPPFVEAIDRFVAELVGAIRSGTFPVASRDEGCVRYCEYATTCRVRQARRVGKRWDEAPRLDVKPSS